MASQPIRTSRFDKPTAAEEAAAEAAKKAEGGNFILNKLSITATNLETYQARDTLITFMHWIALICADICCYFRIGRKGGKVMSKRFVNMFVQLSNCRVMLRLLDDFGAVRDYYRFFKDENAKVCPYLTNIFFSHQNLLKKNQITKPNPLKFVTIFSNLKNPKTKLYFKKKTVHPYVRWLTAVNLVFWVLYNPFEHIGWLAELKIISADDQLWYFYTNCMWAGGLFTSVLL
jgi:hypothetical protein